MIGLLDTSAVIDLERLDPLTLPDEPAISIITVAELAAGVRLARGRVRAAREGHLRVVRSSIPVLPFGEPEAEAFGEVAAGMRALGRKVAGRRFDALIAATALVHGLVLHTLNPDDVTGIAGLEVSEPRLSTA